MERLFLCVLLTLAIVSMASAQTPDWTAVAAEVVKGNTNYEKFYFRYSRAVTTTILGLMSIHIG